MIIILSALSVLIILCLTWLIIAYSFLVPGKKGLTILMYHKVSENTADGLTIPARKLDQQLFFIREQGFSILSFKELLGFISKGLSLPQKPLILTFDDAYENFRTYAFPLLKKNNFKATVFMPVAFMGKTNTWDNGHDLILGTEAIKELTRTEAVEIGLHSFRHRNYAELSIADIKQDLLDCKNTLDSNEIPFVPVLAYPFGGFPRKDKQKLADMMHVFRENKIDLAVRIGNRINPLPIRDPYELKRIDIKGTDNFFTFKIKLKKGRKKLFS
jgi:peptidoglycan/xylan/chitin deacetylase (PgdA/CDA1 family)